MDLENKTFEELKTLGSSLGHNVNDYRVKDRDQLLAIIKEIIQSDTYQVLKGLTYAELRKIRERKGISDTNDTKEIGRAHV